jgi:hypothetical protein
MSICIDTPEGIAAYAALARYHALSLEVRTGMKMSRGINVAAIIRRETGLTATRKATLLADYAAWLSERGIEPTRR